ncbi:tail fiber domain-containing protein [Paraburkholderia sp. JPY303]|uniref:tail fiber domain-containing protein n=1 Tax=Paraburkholderia atlantica TaxID=2654982 RepID=UPI001591EDDB|nr:tail fiber domain-containing protein [Paraburkholderia atlantica]NUY33300.1 tail fiber domain-containing protein [Paraburkholderia atlantica]
MSSGGGNTTTTTKSDPWSAQQPYLETAFQGALNQYNSKNADTNSTVAGFTPMQQQAMGLTQGMVNGTNMGYAGALNNSTNSYTTNLLNGNYLNSNIANSGLGNLANNGTGVQSLNSFANGSMNNNPYQTGALNAANDAITRAYQTATAPNTASAMEASGRYGSGAYQNAVNQNQQNLATQLGNTDASLVNSMYQQNMANQLSAGQSLANNQMGALSGLSGNYNTAAQQQLQGSYNSPNLVSSLSNLNSNLYNMGGNQQALAQQQINAPWTLLNNYSNLVQGQYGNNSTTSQPYYSNQGAGALGGAASGAAMGSMFGPWGTGIGAVAGGLMGAFSDRRLKVDIEPTGERLENGLPLYRYRYLWDAPHVRRIGVMSDDVRRVMPSAVSTHDKSGFDRVDYAAIGG